MSETSCDSSKPASDSAETKLPSDAETDSDLNDLRFDPAEASTPSLRPPKLSEAQLLAALELGFCDKYLPSSVTGGEGIPQQSSSGNISTPERSVTNRNSLQGSMINNTAQVNSGQSQSTQNQYPLFVDNYTSKFTEEEQLGLLPPLRRPDINHLPPDVLAVLLKSSRFEEILIPTQRRITTDTSPPSTSSGTTPTSSTTPTPRVSAPEQETPSSTTSSPSTSTNTTVTPTQSGASQASAAKAAFSPFAKEFVPMSFHPKGNVHHQQQDAADLVFAMSQVHVQGQNDAFHGLVDELDGSDCILSTVTDMISQVSKDPASLNRCAKVTVDVLKKYLNDEDTLGIVITLLMEQMISNPNFCYSGAKLFEILRENGIGVGGLTIKPALLNRMNQEFTNCVQNLDDPGTRMRSLGVLRVLSELYMNFSIVPVTAKLHLFSLAALELMKKLMDKDKSPEIIKCTCQLLKLIGWDVENSPQKDVREYFDLVIKDLSYMRMTAGKLEPSSHAMVDMIFKLHSNKWNREQQEESTTPSTPSTNPPPPKGVVYYELPDSDDDYYDDDAAIMIDDEPDEVQAAYEEFLKMSSKK